MFAQNKEKQTLELQASTKSMSSDQTQMYNVYFCTFLFLSEHLFDP